MSGLSLEELRVMLGADKIVVCNKDGVEIEDTEKGESNMYKMTDKEVNQYVQGLVSHPDEDLAAEGLELEAVSMLKELNQEMRLSQLSLQKKVEEVNTLKNRMQELNGKLTACAQLLVRAEEARRAKDKEEDSDTEEGQPGTRGEEASDEFEDARDIPLSG